MTWVACLVNTGNRTVQFFVIQETHGGLYIWQKWERKKAVSVEKQTHRQGQWDTAALVNGREEGEEGMNQKHAGGPSVIMNVVKSPLQLDQFR